MTHPIARALPESGPSRGDRRPDAAAPGEAADKAADIISALRSAENPQQVAALTAALHAVRRPGPGRDTAPEAGARLAQAGPLQHGDVAGHAHQERRATGWSAAVKAA